MSSIIQRVDYHIHLRKDIYSGVEEMIEYSPEFIKEMKEIIAGEHVGPFKNAYELDAYIRSLPDEDEDE